MKNNKVVLFLTGGFGDNLLAVPLAYELNNKTALTIVTLNNAEALFLAKLFPNSRVIAAGSFAALAEVWFKGLFAKYWVYSVASCTRRFRLLNLLAPFTESIGFTSLNPEKSWQAEIGLKYCLTPDLGKRAWKNNLRLVDLIFPGALSRSNDSAKWDFYGRKVMINIQPDEEMARKYAPGIVIHPGSNKYAGGLEKYKRWPLANFFAMAEKLKEADKSSVIYWILGPGEENLLPEISAFAASSPSSKIIISSKEFANSIIDLAKFLKNMRFFIGNDTGIAHLAALAGIPMVSVNSGISQVSYTAQDGVRTKIIWEDADCRGCTVGFSAELANNFKCGNNWICMSKITPEQVLNAVKQEMKR